MQQKLAKNTWSQSVHNREVPLYMAKCIPVISFDLRCRSVTLSSYAPILMSISVSAILVIGKMYLKIADMNRLP